MQILDEYGVKSGRPGLALEGLKRFYFDGSSNLDNDFAAMKLSMVILQGLNVTFPATLARDP